jgi:hypothetical protein
MNYIWIQIEKDNLSSNPIIHRIWNKMLKTRDKSNKHDNFISNLNRIFIGFVDKVHKW